MITKPFSYTLEIGKEICHKIAHSPVGLRKLCDTHEHWPDEQTVLYWRSKIPEFAEMFWEAKKKQADPLFDEILNICDAMTPGSVYVDKVRIDAIKWCAGRLKPKKYGDKCDPQEVNLNVKEPSEETLQIREARNRHKREY